MGIAIMIANIKEEKTEGADPLPAQLISLPHRTYINKEIIFLPKNSDPEPLIGLPPAESP